MTSLLEVAPLHRGDAEFLWKVFIRTPTILHGAFADGAVRVFSFRLS